MTFTRKQADAYDRWRTAEPYWYGQDEPEEENEDEV